MPRQLIEPHPGDKRYVRRKQGKFTKSQDDVGRSLSADRRKKAKAAAKKGEGDRGDRKRDRTQPDVEGARPGGVGQCQHAAEPDLDDEHPKGQGRCKQELGPVRMSESSGEGHTAQEGEGDQCGGVVRKRVLACGHHEGDDAYGAERQKPEPGSGGGAHRGLSRRRRRRSRRGLWLDT